MTSTPHAQTTTLAELAQAYALDPGARTLGALRSGVRGAHNYPGPAALRRTVSELRTRGDHGGVVQALREAMPGAFFAPWVHGVLAQAYAALGDDDRAEKERRISRLAFESILRTGNGTRDEPWTVLHLSDEYDVLDALGRPSSAQRLVVDGDHRFDVHTCGDEEAWFDITGL